MIIVDCLTDNPNRTYGDVRTCFNKVKAKLGASGAVSHLFDHDAIFMFSGPDEDAVLEALAEADVDVTDIEAEADKITVFAPHTEYAKTRDALKAAFDGIEFELDDVQFVPQMTTAIDGSDAEQFEKMLDLLNFLDDVQQVYHNADY
jgi:transcriptional/translational regulatory protein YebC/TACO1